MRQQPDHLDLDARLGDPVLDVGVLGDRLAERHPLQRALAQQVQRALGHADRAHAVVDAPGPEAGLADHEPVALTGQQRVAPGTRTSSNSDLGVALAVLVAEDRQVADDRHAGGVDRHDHHRLLPVRRAVGVGLAHHDQDLAVAVQGVGRPPLAAVDHVLVAVALDPRLDVGGVRGRDGRLGHRERGADLAVEQRLQPAAPCARRCRTASAPPCCRCRARCSSSPRGARCALRPMISASGAYSAFVRPGPHSGCGWKRFHRPRAARLRLELLEDRRMEVRVAGRLASAAS